MKTTLSFVIQDVVTKEYFWQYRIEEGFSTELIDANLFYSEEEAVNRMEDEYLEDLFDTRTLEIRKFYNLNKLK